MSVKISAWVWENGPTKPAEKLLLLALADHANDDGLCYPSVERLSEMLSCTERYVRRLRDNLIESGYISLLQKGGVGRSNLYRVNTVKAPVPSNVELVDSEKDVDTQRNYSSANKDDLAANKRNYSSAKVNDSSEKVNYSSAEWNYRPPEPSRTIIEPSTTTGEQSSRAETTDKKARRSPRKRDELFEAMCEAFGQPETPSERGRINRALSELRKAEATPEQVAERFAEATRRWGTKVSPQTLASRWGSLAIRESNGVDLKGNAQLGKDFLPFTYSDGKDMAEKLGAKVFD